ncbi:14850_t:CDS:2, partial [Cetraspora pellucida]
MSTSSSSNSGWKSAVNKVKKIRNKVDKIVHNYPKLPKHSLEEENLPFQIGSKVSVKDYNTFLDRNESTGYKFHWDSGNVYIVDMANPDHEGAVRLLQKFFEVPNGGVIIDPPIYVGGQEYHYDPTVIGKKLAPDIAIYPDVAYVPNPTLPHPGPPPSDVKGNPHARIFCEVASSQSVALWGEKCKNWMHEQYVRCVLGIKLHDIRKGGHHRSMTAKLWTRQRPAPPAVSATVPTMPGIFVQEWDFGTLQYNSSQATGCTGANIPAYQISIPVSDVFWDPPIVTETPNTTGYSVTVPNTVVGNNFIIDLYRIQQM